MENMTFHKQKLDEQDHKKTDDAARRLRTVLGAAGAVAAAGLFVIRMVGAGKRKSGIF